MKNFHKNLDTGTCLPPRQNFCGVVGTGPPSGLGLGLGLPWHLYA